jgi:hypothetical protein
MDWGDPKDQQQQTPDEPTDQEQQDQEQQTQDPGQQDPGQNDSGQKDPGNGEPVEIPPDTTGEKPKDDKGDETTPTESCVEEETLKDKLDEQKWDNKKDQIESECDQKLKKCLIEGNDALLKLYEEIKEIVKKYRKEYDDFNKQYECAKKTNEALKNDIPGNIKDDINKVIDKVINKIENLKTCKEKLKCLVVKENKCDDQNYTPVETKPSIILDCKKADIWPKTLKDAENDLERSKKHHEIVDKVFNELKALQATILDTLKKIKEYQKKVDEACNEGQKCLMYAYILLISRTIEGMEVHKPDDFEKKLKESLEELRKAIVDLCFKEYAKDKIEAMIALVTKSIEETEKSRDDDILNRIVDTST